MITDRAERPAESPVGRLLGRPRPVWIMGVFSAIVILVPPASCSAFSHGLYMPRQRSHFTADL
jgi:hypothetical protein